MTKAQATKIVTKFMKKQITLERCHPTNRNELSKLCEENKWNIFVMPVDNTSGHSYDMGEIYKIVSIDNVKPHYRACLIGDETSVGNWMTLADAEIYIASTRKVIRANGRIIDRLVIPDTYRQLIFDAVNQASEEVQDKIFNQWGFGDTIEKGKGIIILLYGPPGTGKSMCAEGITEMLDKDYIILNSGAVQSNIPGQTERNIAEAFKRATKEDLVLILDECDSLLYNRDEVGAILSAEINALLTEIERFEGICILTTNRSERLDPALERRICLKLRFDRPDKSVRVCIWQKLMPKQCPLESDVKFEELAEFDLTGGQIKNALLTGARTAVGMKADKLGREHLLIGINVERLGDKMWDSSSKYRTGTATDVKKRIDMKMGVDGTIRKEIVKVESVTEMENIEER